MTDHRCIKAFSNRFCFLAPFNDYTPGRTTACYTSVRAVKLKQVSLAYRCLSYSNHRYCRWGGNSIRRGVENWLLPIGRLIINRRLQDCPCWTRVSSFDLRRTRKKNLRSFSVGIIRVPLLTWMTQELCAKFPRFLEASSRLSDKICTRFSSTKKKRRRRRKKENERQKRMNIKHRESRKKWCWRRIRRRHGD